MDVRSIDTLPQPNTLECNATDGGAVWTIAEARGLAIVCQSLASDRWWCCAVWTIAEACSLAGVRQSLCMRQMVVLCVDDRRSL